MRIGNFEFNFGRVKNAATNQSGDGRVLKKITSTQLVRSKSQIKDWTTAVERAESKIRPDRTELIRIYNNIVVDPHLSAVMLTLKLKILNMNWTVKKGENIDDSTVALLKSTWFRSILEMSIDSIFYGYSLIQLGDMVNGEPEIELIPREYVIPEWNAIKTKINASTLKEMILIDDPEFANWLIFSNSGDLGLLYKAAPIVIMKRAVMSAWSEYAEIFGMPIRVGKTDIRDPKKFANMDAMLANMGSAAYGVFDPSDLIEFIQTSGTDAFQVYNEFLKAADAQLSKLFLGQTGTTDEKSFSGSANVHSGILNAIVESYIDRIVYFINGVILPKLVQLGLIAPGLTFAIVGENQVSQSLSNLSPLVANKILESMTTNEIRDLIGLPPDNTIQKKAPGQIQTPVAELLSKLYADELHNELTNELG